MNTLWKLRSLLRLGDIWAQNSRKFADPESYLIPKSKWPSLKNEFVTMVNLAPNFKDHLEEKKQELDSLYSIVEKYFRKIKTLVKLGLRITS